MKEVMKYFGYTSASEFKVDWVKLTTADKAQLTEGIRNESLTY
jgi:cephalosporin-C deacetylase-like acetyl esterase